MTPGAQIRQDPKRTPLGSVYILALCASLSTWLLTARAPLYMDEAGSWWIIRSGPAAIWDYRLRALGFPAYYFLLYFWTRLFGTTELALHSLSLVAMLAAAAVLYRAARELFTREASLIALIIFALDPITVSEATEVRPYACALLATSIAILLLFRLARSNSLRLAALFGVAAALPVYFHYLFAVILPGFILCFFLLKTPRSPEDRRIMGRQFSIALAAFALAFLPLIPGIRYLFRTAKSHNSVPPPHFSELLFTLVSGYMAPLLVATGLVALVIAALRRAPSASPQVPSAQPGLRTLLACASIGLVPVLTLYLISVATPIEVFVFRHRLEAIPGIALCWAWLIARLRPAWLRPLFCLALAAVTAYGFFTTPMFRLHYSTAKYALQVVQQQDPAGRAPVLFCSTFVESDDHPMPLRTAKTSRFFPQLAYYPLSAPVVPLPRDFDAQTVQIASQFLTQATRNHQPFFAIGFVASFRTLDWLTAQASSAYTVRDLGVYAHYKVLEFTPRPTPEPPSNPSQNLVKPPRP